jgi:hypothetical protein
VRQKYNIIFLNDASKLFTIDQGGKTLAIALQMDFGICARSPFPYRAIEYTSWLSTALNLVQQKNCLASSLANQNFGRIAYQNYNHVSRIPANIRNTLVKKIICALQRRATPACSK